MRRGAPLPTDLTAGNTLLMVPQSRPLVPAVLLTRPEAQGARFAAAPAEALGPVRLVTSPLMVPAFLVPAIPLRPDA